MPTIPPLPTRRTVLVTGFGPFGEVANNPTAHIAEQLGGRRIAHHTVVGRVLSVSYERGLADGVSLMEALSPVLTFGLGVHRGSGLSVETVGRNRVSQRGDIDGIRPSDLGDGPKELSTTLNGRRIAEAMGAQVSTDAGAYLCNAWLYTMLRHGTCPCIFVHVPPRGVAVERIAAGVRMALQDLGLARTNLR